MHDQFYHSGQTDASNSEQSVRNAYNRLMITINNYISLPVNAEGEESVIFLRNVHSTCARFGGMERQWLEEALGADDSARTKTAQ